ncbi:response regulator [Vibrio vulnificus]|uniref:response regulator n=1 Tax=Vibrio vulnificus TaxID=672 RepID=UPI001A2ED3C4|nr:response regulator [Vibrio vulnificus]
MAKMYKKILIVDDVELLIKVMSISVSSCGDDMVIHKASNAYEAMNKIKNNTYDVIIMDMMMPNGDGFELLSLMSSEEVLSPIIIISSLDRGVLNSIVFLCDLYELNLFCLMSKQEMSINLSKMVSLVLSVTDASLVKDSECIGRKITSHDMYPMSLMYKKQVISDSGKAAAFELWPLWHDYKESFFPLSQYFPSVRCFFDNFKFIEFVIKMFKTDYVNYFRDLDRNISFYLNLHPSLLKNDEAKGMLLSLLLDVQHTIVISFYESDIHNVNSDFWDKVNALKEKGFEFRLAKCRDVSLILHIFEKIPLSYVEVDEMLMNDFHRYSDEIKKIRVLSRINEAKVLYDGVNSIEIKNYLESRGEFFQTGLMYGFPVSAELLCHELA